MITGDNPLTAVHVARDVEIVDRDVMILDVKEGATSDEGETSEGPRPYALLTNSF
jgi:magnesium-transporting ATPase (P-type)